MRDAPAVLGPEAWRRADELNTTSRLRRSLAKLNEEMGGSAIDVEVTTTLLNGALNEAALWIAGNQHRKAALKRAYDSFEHLISSVITQPTTTRHTRGPR